MKATRILSMAAALALALSANAFAGKPGDNGNNNGSNTAYGGQGGNAYGGSGGNGTGVGIGIGQGGAGGKGGSVVGSGNSSNLNNNSNKQNQGQAQGQIQGQGQSQVSKNSNRNSNNNANLNRNDNRSSANSSASNANSNTNEGNNSSQSVTVQGDSYEAYRIPVATAYAPNIAPTAVCMGSSSGGVQTQIVGVSLGTSWTDDNCMLLEQVRTVAVVLNDPATAARMMCDVPAYAKAAESLGKSCKSTMTVASTGPVGPTIYAVEKTESKVVPNSRYEGNDPIVRKRLGLPPLN